MTDNELVLKVVYAMLNTCADTLESNLDKLDVKADGANVCGIQMTIAIAVIRKMTRTTAEVANISYPELMKYTISEIEKVDRL